MGGMDLVADLNPAYPGKDISFTDDSDFTGEAKGSGWRISS